MPLISRNISSSENEAKWIRLVIKKLDILSQGMLNHLKDKREEFSIPNDNKRNSSHSLV